jgi:hypothetical protein
MFQMPFVGFGDNKSEPRRYIKFVFWVDAVANRPRFGGDSQVHSWHRPAGKVQLNRDQLDRTRQVLDRKGFLLSISSSSSPR